MAHSAGVCRQIDPVRKAVGAAVTGYKAVVHEFCELRCLIDKDDIVLLPLVLQHIALGCTVAKADPAAVGEYHCLFAVPVGRYRWFQCLAQLHDVVVPQVCIGAPQYDDLYSGVIQRQQRCLCPYRPAFSAASCPAVGDTLFCGAQEYLLLGVWCA